MAAGGAPLAGAHLAQSHAFLGSSAREEFTRPAGIVEDLNLS